MSDRLIGVGVVIFALATAAMGGLEALRGASLPGLHAYPGGTPAWLIRAGGAALAVASIALLASRGGFAAALWAIGFALTFIAALADATNPLVWVPVAECGTFAAFAFWRTDDARGWTIARLVFAATLLLFGAIHLMQRETIGSLIPDWVPLRACWPFVTGGVSMIASLTCLAGRGAAFGAGAVGLMYLSWLPVVHLPRLLASPASLFEWTFALTALALSGVALAIAGRSARRR